MNKRFENLQFAHELWQMRRRDGSLIYGPDGISFCCDGLRFQCNITEFDDVTVRTDRITNTTDHPITFIAPRMKFCYCGGEYEVYTQFNNWQSESMGAWQPLNTTVEAACRSVRTAHGAAPILALRSLQTSRGTVFHLMAESTWRLTAVREPIGGSLHGVEITAGYYNEPSVTLAPGESHVLPTVVFYDFQNRLDLDAWKLHRWFHAQYPRRTLPIIYDTWLYRFDHFTPEQIAGQVDAAADLGIEYFVIDAGWFGTFGQWFTSVGDWYETETSAMRGQMLQIAEKVRARGMKFGLWFEIERADASSEIVKAHPEYFICTDHSAYFLDFANSATRTYILNTVHRLVEKYGIEFIKFDFNRDLFDDYTDCAFTDYFAGHRAFLAELKAQHPEIYLQNCAGGGERMQLSDAACFDSFWATDNQSPYETLRITKDSMLRLPPQVLERWVTITSLPEFKPAYAPPYWADKILATNDATWENIVGIQPSFLKGVLHGAPMGFSCDLTAFTPALAAQLKTQIADFKENRAFWLQAECRILTDTDSLLVLQYNDALFSRIELLVFSNIHRQAHAEVYPIVDRTAVYTTTDKTYSGARLTADGLFVKLNGSYGMQHIILQKQI